MNNPLVSVCIITYRHEKYIRQSIESALEQRLNCTWEIIIADDYSPDGTRDILLEYKQKYPDLIRLLLQEKNVGGGRNFTDLLSAAKGKYIAYLEGDDYWADPGKLQRQINFLEANPDYGFVSTDASFFIERDHKMVTYPLIFPRDTDITIELLLKKNRVISLTSVFRTDVFSQSSGILTVAEDRKWKMGDYPLWLEMAGKTKLRYMNSRSGVYRVLQNSVTGRHDVSKNRLFEESVYEVQKYFIERFGISSRRLIRSIEGSHSTTMLRLALRSRDKKQIRAELKSIIAKGQLFAVAAHLTSFVLTGLSKRS